MKFINSIFSANNDQKLFGKIIFFSIVAIGVCSNIETKTKDVSAIKINYVYNQLDDFDQVHIPNKPPVIAQMISVLKPKFSHSKRAEVAKKIHHAFLKYEIEPQIIVAIIDTESDFDHDKVSETGDLSLAQINVDVWNKEFERMNLSLIDVEKLKADQSYSLEVMAQILHVLKTRYEKKDRKWYARYHSKTKKHKDEYLSKLDSRLRLLKNSRLVAIR